MCERDYIDPSRASRIRSREISRPGSLRTRGYPPPERAHGACFGYQKSIGVSRLHPISAEDVLSLPCAVRRARATRSLFRIDTPGIVSRYRGNSNGPSSFAPGDEGLGEAEDERGRQRERRKGPPPRFRISAPGLRAAAAHHVVGIVGANYSAASPRSWHSLPDTAAGRGALALHRETVCRTVTLFNRIRGL